MFLAATDTVVADLDTPRFVELADGLLEGVLAATEGGANRLGPRAGVAIASESPDLIFVYAQLRDANGNPVYDNGIPISLTATGNLELVNPEPVVSERGQGAFLIKTFGEPDGATITVESPELGAASYTF